MWTHAGPTQVHLSQTPELTQGATISANTGLKCSLVSFFMVLQGHILLSQPPASTHQLPTTYLPLFSCLTLIFTVPSALFVICMFVWIELYNNNNLVCSADFTFWLLIIFGPVSVQSRNIKASGSSKWKKNCVISSFDQKHPLISWVSKQPTVSKQVSV